jgi:hypothetical protein
MIPEDTRRVMATEDLANPAHRATDDARYPDARNPEDRRPDGLDADPHATDADRLDHDRADDHDAATRDDLDRDAERDGTDADRTDIQGYGTDGYVGTGSTGTDGHVGTGAVGDEYGMRTDPADEPHDTAVRDHVNGMGGLGTTADTTDTTDTTDRDEHSYGATHTAAATTGAGTGIGHDQESGAGDALFDGGEAEEFRARWRELQVGFVDEPRSAVERADELVTEVLQSLANTFATHKRELDGQWRDRGEVETEDLRLALREYRSFFDQLLRR